MPKVKTYTKYIKELFSLALPMIMGNLGMILIGAGDVFVAAKHSTNTLASISIANSIISTIFMFGIGLIVSVSPLLSNFRGEKENVKKYFLPTINYAMVLAFLSCIVVLLSVFFVDKMNFDPILVPAIKKYMFICAFSVFGAYLQIALKEYLQAFEIVFFPNLINILGVFIHLFLDFVFVFGWFGLPAMGAVGLAVATLLSRTIFGLWMLGYCLKFVKVKRYSDFGYYLNLLKIGFPIAIAILIEFIAFNMITIVMGRVSGLYAAAQSVLLTITTATFMIPLAISNAIAVKVGFANGAKNFVDMKCYSYSGVGISVGFMSLSALGFLFFPKSFVNIFTQDVELVKICLPIMLLAGIFQIFDGLQVSLGGVFKGLKKTNIIMAGDFAAYWLIGFPLGCLLAFKFNMGLYGFWVGLTVSISLLAIIFLLILFKQFGKIKRAKC